jgi:hypothetical protein
MMTSIGQSVSAPFSNVLPHFHEIMKGQIRGRSQTVLHCWNRCRPFDLTLSSEFFSVCVHLKLAIFRQLKHLLLFPQAMLLSQTWNPQRDWDENNGTCPGDKCLYNLDFSLRPVGNLWEDLYYREWMTQNVTGSTNANGEFAFRGFAGKYGIAVSDSWAFGSFPCRILLL